MSKEELDTWAAKFRLWQVLNPDTFSPDNACGELCPHCGGRCSSDKLTLCYSPENNIIEEMGQIEFGYRCIEWVKRV